MMGSELKTEREKRGLTIQDIERETSIRSVYLEALEQGNYKVLPGEVYVKGFIRNYADFLGLNSERLVQEYREEIHGADVAPVSTNVPETTSIVNEKAPFASGSDFHDRLDESRSRHVKYMAAAAVILAFVGSIFYFFGEDPAAVKQAQTAQNTQNAPAAQQNTAQKPQNTGSAQSVQPQNPQSQNTAPAAQNNRQSVQQPAQQPMQQQPVQQPAPVQTIGNTASASAGGSDVTAKFTGRCWIKVIADGKTVFEDTVQPNQTMRWTGKDSVVILAGNAGAMDVTYNGQRIGSMGKVGTVIEKKFSHGKVEDVK